MTEAKKDLKALSKQDYNTSELTFESLQISCLMRIADASELMAQRHRELLNEIERLNQKCTHLQTIRERQSRSIDTLMAQIRGLKGYVTRLKKQMKHEKAD